VTLNNLERRYYFGGFLPKTLGFGA